jgi:peptide/nickel transport system substrate-binding protein
LCEGVRFHDGSPLVADHVVTALQGQLKSRALRNVTGIEAANRLEIRVALSAPDTGFPFLLCSPEFAIQIGANGAMPQGTGPYRVSRYRSGERLDAIRSGQAHHAGEGHFDRVQILTSGTQGHRVQLLRSGRVDALVEIAPALAPQLLSSPGLQVGWVRNARYLIFDMSKIAPKNLRRRLKNAVNSEAMLRDVLRGHGRSIFPGGTPEIKAHGPSSEIGITQGTGFDETAARLVACLAGSSVSAGISFCSGRGTHGSFSVRWAESAEALAVQASRSRSEVVVLAADAVGVVSDRLIGPVRTGSRLPLDDARIARRWWLA